MFKLINLQIKTYHYVTIWRFIFMKILALDVATHCGWAISDNGKILGSGTWDFTVKRDESTSMKFIRLKSELNKILVAHGIDLLVFEAARHAGLKMQGALVSQSELQAIVKNWCDENGMIAYRGYSSKEIKKHATGNGNSKKEDMINAAKEKFQIKIVDDNQADALWLLDLAANEYGMV